MNISTISRHRLALASTAGVMAAVAPWIATAAAASTEPPVPPIAVEEFTRLDQDTLVRGAVTDDVTATMTIGREGHDPITLEIADLSNVAVARFTIQPGVQFPWHSHPGAVLVTVTQGELVYVMADDCSEHPYPTGTAFVDPGHGMIHSAYNPTDGETVIIATFVEMTADGPLSTTEGITAPAENCGLATSPPG